MVNIINLFMLLNEQEIKEQQHPLFETKSINFLEFEKMAEKSNRKELKLKDILYSADVRSMLRWSRSTLQRYEEKGLPFYRVDENDEKSIKMYIEEEVVNWLLRHKRGT